MDFERMLDYCAKLELNNNREWFHANHEEYTAAKADFTELVDRLKYRAAELTTPDLAEKLIFSDAKSMLYRIPRDMRVFKNRPPYNPSFRADISAGRHTALPVGYFLMIAPGNRSLFGTGAWCPDRETLNGVRDYIIENCEKLDEILDETGIILAGEMTKRVPAGYDPDSPAADYLRRKEWFTCRSFRDAELTDFDSFTELVAAEIEKMEPFRIFCNAALSRRKQTARDPEIWR